MTSREVSAFRLEISLPALAPLKRYVENKQENLTLESSESHLFTWGMQRLFVCMSKDVV